MKIAVIVSDAFGYAHAGLDVVRIVKTFDMPQEIKDYFNANEQDYRTVTLAVCKETP